MKDWLKDQAERAFCIVCMSLCEWFQFLVFALSMRTESRKLRHLKLVEHFNAIRKYEQSWQILVSLLFLGSSTLLRIIIVDSLTICYVSIDFSYIPKLYVGAEWCDNGASTGSTRLD